MTVRTDVLVHATTAQGAGNLVTITTVPTGEVWLCRELVACNRVGATATLMLLMLRSGVSVKWLQGSIAASTPIFRDNVFFVAEGGDVLQGLSTVAGAVDWGVYGARLVLP